VDQLAPVDTTLLHHVETQSLIESQFDEILDFLVELRYIRRGPAYFNSIARRLRVMETGPLADMLDDAIDEGRLSNEDRDTILLADIVLTGRRREGGEAVYLLAEISAGVGASDVERAADRAAILAKLGTPVLPIVAGKWINDQAVEMAGDRGVWYVIGGRVTPPLLRRTS
jgi:hypothetical protein